ncbi:hypothetical protein F2Q68_00044069 [Brassica cretica]|uniref:Uncharacterized protein n=2 Tax=Brassica cretica TaxID=69181 RepID=A0A3N6Q3F0_BRACR|nr:hypothetical protein F2Q68_00044069 [Brassica cretica]KAF3521096.1 hypothetical protein DY000_02060100 [Brassica cretica]
MSCGLVSIDVRAEISIDVEWKISVDGRVASVDGGERVSVNIIGVWVDGGWRESSDDLVLWSIDEERLPLRIERSKLAGSNENSNEIARLRVYIQVHAQQYQKQQGNSTGILIRSCKLGAFNPQGSTFLIDRQQHLFVARFLPTTVDPGTSPVDRHSLTIIDRRHSSSVDRHFPSDIDRYFSPEILSHETWLRH